MFNKVQVDSKKKPDHKLQNIQEMFSIFKMMHV